MADMDRYMKTLVMQLLCNGSVWMPHDHPLNQPGVALFTYVSSRLQHILGDEALAMEMKSQEGSSLITLKVGDGADEAPDFSPPEPKLS